MTLYAEPFWSRVLWHINACRGEDQVICSIDPVHGGDINTSFRMTCDKDIFFVKTNDSSLLAMFEAEQFALNKLRDFCPSVICSGHDDAYAYLVLAHVELNGQSDEAQLGEHIATMHSHKYAHSRFGWHHDNYIGTTRQKNNWRENWTEFWWDMRLYPQLTMAYAKGYRNSLGHYEKPLHEAVVGALAEHEPRAALLHGDLWSGNKGFAKNGAPTIFDPAAYYGDPETDLAMTALFGGFGPAFYGAYHKIHPPRRNHERRRPIYQLYHVLNHVNLFGDAYVDHGLDLIGQIIATQ